MIPIVPVLASIRACLLADPLFKERIGNRLYAHVPQGCTFPYGILRLESAIDASDQTQSGTDMTVMLDIFSRDQSDLRVYELLSAAHSALDNRDLALAEPAQAILCQFDDLRDVFLDEDGQTHHGVIAFRILTTNNPD